MEKNTSNTTWSPIIGHTELTIWYSISSSLCIIGTAASVLLLLTLFRQKNYRDGANPLIIHYLAVDCFVLAIPSLASHASVYLTQTNRTAIVPCVPVFFLQWLFICLSHLTSLCLAINRCAAVLLPHSYNVLSGKTAIVTMIAICWIISLASTLPYLFNVVASYGIILPLGHCSIAPNNLRIYGIMASFTTTIPFSIQGVCYAVVIISFCRCKRAISTKTDNRTRRQRRERKTSVVLILCFLWYMLCYLPITMGSLYAPWFWKTHWDVYMWARMLLTCGPAGTPFVFILGNAEYRSGIKSLVKLDMSSFRPVTSSASGRPNTVRPTGQSTIQDSRSRRNGKDNETTA